MNAKSVETVAGVPSVRVASRDVEAFVTLRGGHLAPVTFARRGHKIQPYHIAPWAGEKPEPEGPEIIRVLRGDFFCMPFGANQTPHRGEKHPVHGETANGAWTLESLEHKAGRATARLSMNTTIRKGRVEKVITLLDGHNVVYCQHILSGMSGPMSFGHHAMLRFPPQPGSGALSASPFLFGQVFPGAFEDPAQFGYSSLKPGAEFLSLRAVPMAAGGKTNLTYYPARRGFEDLVMLISDLDGPFAWTAVTFPKQGYVWFALKNPRLLRQTILWHSNGGRHYPPWNGRHTNVLGIEDVLSYFHLGLAESVRPNPISQRGIPTHMTLDPRQPTVVPYIMGVAIIPTGFDRVVSITPAADAESVVLISNAGPRVRVPVRVGFLLEGRLDDED